MAHFVGLAVTQMADTAKVTLPTSMRDAVHAEFARTLTPPYENIITVAVNGALMSSAWVFLPTGLKDKVFTLHGSLAFALVLAAWMYSDIPATNVFGPDTARVIAAIGDPVMLRRLLYAKNIVLWCVVTPVCAVAAVIIGALNHAWLATVYTVVWIGVVPFGTLGISAWVGIRFPYHPMPLRFRWEHRRPWWRMLGRWFTLVITPYGLVPLLAFVLMIPSLVLWGLVSAHGLSHKLPDTDLGWGTAVACVIALGCTVGGHRVGVRMAQRRHEKLVDFLGDPARG